MIRARTFIIPSLLFFSLVTEPALAGCGETLMNLARDAIEQVSQTVTPRAEEFGVGNPTYLLQSAITDPRRISIRPQATVRPAGEDGEAGQFEVRLVWGANWQSIYRAAPNAVLGDPRFIYMIFRNHPIVDALAVGDYLGFQLLSDRRMLIPGAERLSSALASLQLEGAPTFYSSNGRETSREFLQRFANNRGLPIANTPLLRLHDISFHAGAFLIPADAMLHAQKQARYFLEFIDFIQPQMEGDPRRQKAVAKWIDRMAQAIDVGTGNFVISLTETDASTTREAKDAAVAYGYGTLTHQGRSPYELLGTEIQNHSGSVNTWLRAQFAEFTLARAGGRDPSFFDALAAGATDQKLAAIEARQRKVIERVRIELLERSLAEIQAGRYTSAPNLEITASAQGEHGQITLTRLAGEPWYSLHNPVSGGDAKLGDPRWFLAIFSEYSPQEVLRIGNYFGFSLIDDRTLLVPGVFRLRQSVQALQLEARPTFYETQGHHSERAYLQRFVSELGVPMDTQSLLRAHDLAFHAGTILIPPEALLHARRQIAALLDFMEFARSRTIEAPPEFPVGALQIKFEGWIKAAATAIDTGSGNFASRLARGNLANATQSVYEPLVAFGRSPRQYLEALITPTEFSGLPKIDPQMGHWLTGRLNEYSARQGPELNRRLYDVYDATRFTTQVRERIRDVVQQVLRLSPP